jgi:hypothetical protein
LKTRLTGKAMQVFAAVAIYLYVIFRFVGVYGAFRPYHVNPWIFLILDLVTAAPYAYGWPRLIVALVELYKERSARSVEKAMLWGLVVAVSFATPYVYIAIAARDLPDELVVSVIVMVSILLCFMLIRLGRALCNARSERGCVNATTTQ